MLATQITFLYQGDDAEKLAKFAGWITENTGELNSREFARLLEMYFEHSHLLFNQALSKLNSEGDILLPVTDAERLRDLLADILVSRRMNYESVPGRLSAPLLRDLYSYNARMKAKGMNDNIFVI